MIVSCGIVPVCKQGQDVFFLLIQHISGAEHWSFPKGHVEKGEEFLETAMREFAEETGISAKLLNIEREISYETKYQVLFDGKMQDKNVVWFLGFLEKKEVVSVQASELQNYAWLCAEDALTKITYSEDKVMLEHFIRYL